MPYTYQPSSANYCFYHEDGYRVCVGDGSKPSQLKGDRRKQKPHGVPILLKIKDKPNPVAEAQKKKAAKIRKKEYDRLYAAANRKLKNPEKKEIKDKALIEKVGSKGIEEREEVRLEEKREKQLLRKQKQKEAKEKLEKLKATNDKLKKVREKKDNKEKQLAITKYESKWKNTDKAKEFKKKMDGIKAQKDGEAKKKALAKVKKDEKAAKDKHIEIKKNSILVLQSDIDKLEKEENKAYGVALIKEEKEREEKLKEFRRERAAKKIQTTQKERIKRKKELREKTLKIIEESEKEIKRQEIINEYNETYLPFKALVLANEKQVKDLAPKSVLARMIKFALEDGDFEDDFRTKEKYGYEKIKQRDNEIEAMKSGIKRIQKIVDDYKEKERIKAEKEREELLEKERIKALEQPYREAEKDLIKVQSVIRRKLKTRYGNLPQKVRVNMSLRDAEKETEKVLKEFKEERRKLEEKLEKGLDEIRSGDSKTKREDIRDLTSKIGTEEVKLKDKLRKQYDRLNDNRRSFFKEIIAYDAGRKGIGGKQFSLFVKNLENENYGIKEVKKQHNKYNELLEKMETQTNPNIYNIAGETAKEKEENYTKGMEELREEAKELASTLNTIEDKLNKYRKTDKAKYKKYKKMNSKTHNKYMKKNQQIINSIQQGRIVDEDYKPFSLSSFVYNPSHFGL